LKRATLVNTRAGAAEPCLRDIRRVIKIVRLQPERTGILLAEQGRPVNHFFQRTQLVSRNSASRISASRFPLNLP